VISSQDEFDTSGIRFSTRPAGVSWESQALLKTAEKSIIAGMRGLLIAVDNFLAEVKVLKTLL
jgi:hypothetical protein